METRFQPIIICGQTAAAPMNALPTAEPDELRTNITACNIALLSMTRVNCELTFSLKREIERRLNINTSLGKHWFDFNYGEKMTVTN